jgi:hypothetical protein
MSRYVPPPPRHWAGAPEVEAFASASDDGNWCPVQGVRVVRLPGTRLAGFGILALSPSTPTEEFESSNRGSIPHGRTSVYPLGQAAETAKLGSDAKFGRVADAAYRGLELRPRPAQSLPVARGFDDADLRDGAVELVQHPPGALSAGSRCSFGAVPDRIRFVEWDSASLARVDDNAKAAIAVSGAGGALLLGALGLGWWVSRDIHPRAAVIDPAISAPPAPIDPAVDFVRVLRRDHPAALRCTQAEAAWASVHDESRAGFEAYLKANKAVVAACSAGQAKADAATPCAAELETRVRAFVAAIRAHRSTFVTWLEASRAKLEPAMRGRTFIQACDAGACTGEPVASETTTSGFSVECAPSFFRCEPPTGNVCGVEKLACRLGLDPDCKPGPVASKATGYVFKSPVP